MRAGNAQRQAKEPADAEAPAPFFAGYLPYLLARASFLVSREFHEQLAPCGIDVPTWRVLAILSDGAGMTIGDLAAIALLKQPTLTKVVDRMEAAGLVRRGGGAEDRRKVLVTIAPAGRDLVTTLLPRALAHEAVVLGDYTADEKRLLKRVLTTLIERTGVERAGR
ncbi:MAG TPA: MarR family winged helix-turn-helix transcriptional regulator [Stellaceae bacterium]|nr:MarR family winged helix-turn-helix transcriptional regulator [Stellaceae bacterium]